ncbi:hypothetical protein K9N68_38535 (plasmid) [Kovacikia minuta CCNUW1]|uniref:hypothetical protein n=1 Tax=Kovacikia minuta TaxID=2931930 RepID=UPI001CCFECB3|nr:hypothetical protein [Kovacikia minuta]UBF30085.1 hypothetical protein K9N68_38535 [Kovacikia minuta CCNUW1]
MYKANQLHQGRAEFVILAGKDDETYCGLERDAEHYLYSGEVQNTLETFTRMSQYQGRLKRFAGFPTIFVMDEYNNSLESARMYDRLAQSRTKHEDLISALTYERITKGRSKLVCDWITSHEPDVRAIKLSLSLQQSLNFIVLARGNKFGAIHAALSGRRAIVDDDLIREQLYQQFTQYRQANSTDFNVVIALTNLMGDWRLVTLPKYPDAQPEIYRPVDQGMVHPQTPSQAPQATPPQPSQPDFRAQLLGWLGDCWHAEVGAEGELSKPKQPLSTLSELAQGLVQYITRKGLLGQEQNIRSLRQNWGASQRGLSAEGFLDLLKEITAAGHGTFIGEKGWICRSSADE